MGLTKKETERLQRRCAWGCWCTQAPAQLSRGVHRFSRISRDGSQVDISDLAAVDELRSNPFVVRAFALFDSDCDGSLSLQDFTRAIDVLGHLNNTEQQLMCTREVAGAACSRSVPEARLRAQSCSRCWTVTGQALWMLASL